jgi:hypothetical protein
MLNEEIKDKMFEVMGVAMDAEPRSKEQWDAVCDFMNLMEKLPLSNTDPHSISVINHCAVSAISTVLSMHYGGIKEVEDPLVIIETIIKVTLIAYAPFLKDFTVNEMVN